MVFKVLLTCLFKKGSFIKIVHLYAAEEKNVCQLYCESKQNNHALCKKQKLKLMINKNGGGLSSANVSPMLLLKSIEVEAEERIERECRTSVLKCKKTNIQSQMVYHEMTQKSSSKINK